MKKLLIILIFAFTSGLCSAQDEIQTDSLSNYTFIFGNGFKIDTALKSQRVSVFGKGVFINPRISDPDSSVTKWYRNHKDALIKFVSHYTAHPGLDSMLGFKYVWIIDNNDTLNISMVRNGIVSAGTMLNFDDSTEGKNKFLELERQGSNVIKYITLNDYNIFKEKLKNAEKYAYDNKLGIWADEKNRILYSPYSNTLIPESFYNNLLPISELNFRGHSILRKNFDFMMPMIVSNGFLSSFYLDSKELSPYIRKWTEQHPDAIMKKVSSMAGLSHVWIYDINDTLNIDLIRNGILTKGFMQSHKEVSKAILNDTLFNKVEEEMLKRKIDTLEMFNNITFDSLKAQQQRVFQDVRLFISDEEYGIFKQKLEAAENYAKENKLGIWRKKDDE